MEKTSKQMVEIIVKALDAKKGSDIEVLHVADLTVLTEYFVLCTGTSSTQVKALADEAEFKLRQEGITPLRSEGYDSGNWIILDYGSILVNVFNAESREFYQLERLWAEGDRVDISPFLEQQ